jgi:predicted alpha/beta hydrolase family esterase
MDQLLIIPGLGDSGEQHWQSLWLKKFDHSIKVVQDNWDEPTLESWLQTLNETIIRIDAPIVLVAHSLAVSLVAHWAGKFPHGKIKGALLVAPADVDSAEHTPDIVRDFAPMPTSRLPFPSIVVASDNDTFVSLSRAKFFAEKWGSDFVNVGPKGHINSDSNLGLWEEGQNNLIKLMQGKEQVAN